MSLPRRRFLTSTLAVSAGAVLAPRLVAAPSTDTERNAGDLISPAVQGAIDKGLAWLASRQTESGAFKSSGFGRNTAVVSLGGMAWLAGGNTPDRGQYGEQVTKAVRYIIKSADDSGFISIKEATSHGPMYDHGFATLFLAEVYGMTFDTQVREKLEAAVKLIVGSQNHEGGWRYQPKAFEADISVTVCQVMALRAARNAGIHVPNETIDRCIDYVKRCQNADGGFMYMLSGGPSRFPRSAAGIVALYSAGIYEGEEIRKGLEYLMLHLPGSEDFGRDTHAMYGHYYGVQAMWQAGGEHWQKWYPAISELLVKQQQKDGSWPDLICAEYGTAMATIVLQMPNNYLPIFQR